MEFTTNRPTIISDQSDGDQLEDVIVVVVVVASTIGVFLISCCMWHLGKCVYRRITAGQRVTFTTIRNTTENNQHHRGHAPPPYQELLASQESYSSVPPPQYELQQPTILPPYSPDGTTTLPPPYTGEPQDRSGGVYIPQPSYGTVI